MDLSADAWNKRYLNNDIGWDLGQVSPPLKDYFDQLENKNLKILIPGGGNSYEAEYLFNKGFKNVYVIDLSHKALENFKIRVPDFPISNLIEGDFFDLNDSFDLIVEQTFFCALHPELRKAYAQKMHELLNENGKLIGLLFNAPLFIDRPPFGGNKKEYEGYFRNLFRFIKLKPATNSVKSRNGKELFICLEK